MKVTNEKGYSFEIDKYMTDYAQSSQAQWGGNDLPALSEEYVVLKMTKGEEFCGYILFNKKTQEPLSEPMGIDGMACKIDAYKLKIKFDRNGN